MIPGPDRYPLPEHVCGYGDRDRVRARPQGERRTSGLHRDDAVSGLVVHPPGVNGTGNVPRNRTVPSCSANPTRLRVTTTLGDKTPVEVVKEEEPLQLRP
jgi:hypothetical protein